VAEELLDVARRRPSRTLIVVSCVEVMIDPVRDRQEDPMKKTSLAAMTAALALVGPSASGAAAGRSCELPVFGPGANYHPQIKPSDFGPSVTNPLFPLKPGRTLVYTGTKDRKKARDTFSTTSRTKVIDGVTTRVVADRLYLNNVLEERTSDYYAQDRCGNVWYFGEDTATLDRKGNVIDTEGSFHAGVDGAQPGVFMQAHPEVGRRFRQEWYQGHAEDTFRVLSLSAPVTVPYGTFADALKTEETTALEPDVVDNKYYVNGIGEVEELAVQGPLEKLELVEIID
jgi:hypothetical protein